MSHGYQKAQEFRLLYVYTHFKEAFMRNPAGELGVAFNCLVLARVLVVVFLPSAFYAPPTMSVSP